MSVEQVQRRVNQLNKDIVTLERKKADLTKKEADKAKRINTLQRSITKNTSQLQQKSKSRQIESYQRELNKILLDKADIDKKIADKRKRLSDETLRLQKEESRQANFLAKQQERIYKSYEKQIYDLTKKVNDQVALPISEKHIFDSGTNEEFDVFISHATEDKETFGDEFARILQEKYDLKVWYDSLSIKWGDSIRIEIDKGLKKSKFGIVILSRNYINKYWTNYELEALFQIESSGGKVILPIWHDITKKEIQDFSLILAGKLAMNTGIMTPEEIAEKLYEIFQTAL